MLPVSFNSLIFKYNKLVTKTNNWRVSEASETLTGVTQLKIGDVYLFIYMFGRTHVILYFDHHVFF